MDDLLDVERVHAISKLGVKATSEALSAPPRRDKPPTLTLTLPLPSPSSSPLPAPLLLPLPAPLPSPAPAPAPAPAPSPASSPSLQASSEALSALLEATSEGVLGVKRATEEARGAAKRSAAQAAAAASALAEKTAESENDAAMASTAEGQMEAIDQKAAQAIVDEKAAVAKAEELAISNAKAEERGDFSKNSPAADALLAAKEARYISICISGISPCGQRSQVGEHRPQGDVTLTRTRTLTQPQPLTLTNPGWRASRSRRCLSMRPHVREPCATRPSSLPRGWPSPRRRAPPGPHRRRPTRRRRRFRAFARRCCGRWPLTTRGSSRSSRSGSCVSCGRPARSASAGIRSRALIAFDYLRHRVRSRAPVAFDYLRHRVRSRAPIAFDYLRHRVRRRVAVDFV